ncbi:hypothetical protein DXA13_04615 [Clostridium sp. AM58-1XD]|nr:hypothetical protein DXA13_04615 [Clostridium sp. AM58-1XD]
MSALRSLYHLFPDGVNGGFLTIFSLIFKPENLSAEKELYRTKTEDAVEKTNSFPSSSYGAVSRPRMNRSWSRGRV